MPHYGHNFNGLTGFRSLLTTQALFNFGFFGLKSLFVLTLLHRQLFSEADVFELFAALMALAYGTSLIGGWLADHILGIKKTFIIGGITSGIGVSLLAYPSTSTIIIAIALLSLGSGCFKPCFSTALSRLFTDPHDQRKDAAFTRLYMAMNIGGLLGPLVSGFLQHLYGDGAALMVIGLSFISGTGLFYSRFKTITFAQQLMNGSSLFYTIMGLFIGFISLTYLLHYPLYLKGVMGLAIVISLITYGTIFYLSSQPERRHLIQLLPYAVFFTLFCMLFEQAGSSMMIFFERHVDRTIGTITLPSSTLLSLNPILVILFGLSTPLITKRYPQIQQAHGLTKFSGGFIFISLSFAVLAIAIRHYEFIGLGWVGLSLILQTLGEMLIIPIGFSTVSKLAPQRHISLMMSLWMMCIAYGHLLAGKLAQFSLQTHSLTETVNNHYYDFFMNLSIVSALAVIILIFIKNIQYRSELKKR